MSPIILIINTNTNVDTFSCETVIDVDECASAPCRNGGRCLDDIDAYICKCQAGFRGHNCDIGMCVL